MKMFSRKKFSFERKRRRGKNSGKHVIKLKEKPMSDKVCEEISSWQAKEDLNLFSGEEKRMKNQRDLWQLRFDLYFNFLHVFRLPFFHSFFFLLSLSGSVIACEGMNFRCSRFSCHDFPFYRCSSNQKQIIGRRLGEIWRERGKIAEKRLNHEKGKIFVLKYFKFFTIWIFLSIMKEMFKRGWSCPGNHEILYYFKLLNLRAETCSSKKLLSLRTHKSQ